VMMDAVVVFDSQANTLTWIFVVSPSIVYPYLFW
jgi:hypothetical protein